MHIRNFVFCSAIAITSSSAFAGDFYVLGSVGQAHLDSNTSEVGDIYRSFGLTNVGVSLDDTSSAHKVQLGYLLNPNVAIEGGYMNLGTFNHDVTATGITAKQNLKTSGFNIALLGTVPLNDSATVFGKLGALRAKAESSVQIRNTVTGATSSGSADATGWSSILGVGATYKIARDIDVRFEYERIQDIGDSDTTSDTSVNFLSIGIAYRF